jgi:hypothetical protein
LLPTVKGAAERRTASGGMGGKMFSMEMRKKNAKVTEMIDEIEHEILHQGNTPISLVIFMDLYGSGALLR